MYGRIITFKRALIIIAVLLTTSLTHADPIIPEADSSTNGTMLAGSFSLGGQVLFQGLQDVAHGMLTGAFEMGIRTGPWSFDAGMELDGLDLNDSFRSEYDIEQDRFSIGGNLWYVQFGYRFRVSRRVGLIPMLGVGYMNVRESSYPDGMEQKDIPSLESSSYPVPFTSIRLCYLTRPGHSGFGWLGADMSLFLDIRLAWFDFGDSPLDRGPALRIMLGALGKKGVSR